MVLEVCRRILKGGGIETYDIYGTRNGPWAYADHLLGDFRNPSDAAFAGFLQQFKPLGTQ